jgi:hypothetical protein
MVALRIQRLYEKGFDALGGVWLSISAWGQEKNIFEVI